jgi:hypothetical protein
MLLLPSFAVNRVTTTKAVNVRRAARIQRVQSSFQSARGSNKKSAWGRTPQKLSAPRRRAKQPNGHLEWV